MRQPISGCKAETKEYAYDAYGQRLALTQRVGQQTDHYTCGYDPHGSVTMLLGDDGNAKETYWYSPYGGEYDDLQERLALVGTVSGLRCGSAPRKSLSRL